MFKKGLLALSCVLGVGFGGDFKPKDLKCYQEYRFNNASYDDLSKQHEWVIFCDAHHYYGWYTFVYPVSQNQPFKGVATYHQANTDIQIDQDSCIPEKNNTKKECKIVSVK